MTDKLASYIGLAQRANNVLYGEDIICERLRLVKVVLLDGSAPEKYRQRLIRKVGDSCQLFTVGGLEIALHREGVKAIGVTNESLADAIIQILR